MSTIKTSCKTCKTWCCNKNDDGFMCAYYKRDSTKYYALMCQKLTKEELYAATLLADNPLMRDIAKHYLKKVI
jgi:hypothetical protein